MIYLFSFHLSVRVSLLKKYINILVILVFFPECWQMTVSKTRMEILEAKTIEIIGTYLSRKNWEFLGIWNAEVSLTNLPRNCKCFLTFWLSLPFTFIVINFELILLLQISGKNSKITLLAFRNLQNGSTIRWQREKGKFPSVLRNSNFNPPVSNILLNKTASQ